ncbi:HutD family protein [Rhizobium sp. DKSPLA3]|uniref:HutD family protein n=1 Tax=Rhizobium quercicola TaxID=2901226 RepID=A0A9X1NWE7_9HYPH|nr:HutD family protein [Rhizobium quercicola]MCD7111166.1 HutD family protein [Rhizobium quercicola]
MTVLRNSDHRRMPWKNGGGETVEIAVFPADASIETFGWRISMASVQTDGPFSVFPGVDRTLSILDGHGMVLDISGRAPVTLTADDAPHAFPADAATEATLVDGAITDLNIMTRRGAFAHAVERRMVDGTTEVKRQGGTLMLLSLGDVQVGPVRLARLDAMRLDGDVKVRADEPVTVYLIRIDAV